MYEITIPLCYLQAARIFTAKGDVRQCLNGVAIRTGGDVVGSNGAYIGSVQCSAIDNSLPEIIIPNAAIDFFVKKAKSSHVPDVTITWADDRKGTLTNGIAVETFTGLEGAYPDYTRLIPKNPNCEMTQFSWDQLALFERAAEALGESKKVLLKALLVPNGPDNVAVVKLPVCPIFIGLLGPLNSRHIETAFAAAGAVPEKAVEESAEDLV